MNTKITRKEIILFGAVLVLCLALILIRRQRGSGNPAGAVRISAGDVLIGEYPLDEDRTIPIGDTNVCRIENGQAFMLEASCPDGLCMRDFPPIGPAGGMIVCLPNKVVMEGVPGTDPSPAAIDAVSG